MVDITSSATANANVLTQLAKIQQQANEIVANARKEKEALAKNENIKGPSGPVEEFQKTNNKSSSNLKFFATDIGILVQNTSRLNVISTLEDGDTVDFYKFRVAGRGDAYLGRIGDDGTRIQLMNRSGTVIADSNKNAGDKYENFLKLQKGEFELSSGEYHIRVSRDEGVDKKASLNFALQLRMGDYKQDYDTIVKQPKAGDDPFALSSSVTELSSMLNSSVSFFNSYQFGRSGSDKLLGSMFDGFV